MINNRDVICFFGDSMTANGSWEAEIYQTVGKSKDIKCYNCGVSGSTASAGAEYIHSFCLEKNPDKVVIMFGINDICRWVFSSKYEKDDAEEVVARAVERHAEKMEYLVECVKAHDAEPILCIAPPYDEYNERTEENLRCDHVMARCAEIVRDLAEKHGCLLVDYRTPMLAVIKERQPISPDRVHPNVYGYHMMAQIFLKTLGEIEECDFETPFELEAWNAERCEVERIIKRLDFVDYNAFFGKHLNEGWGVPEKLAECRARYEAAEDKTAFIPTCYKLYIENSAIREDLMGKLVRLTIYPRQAKK